MANASAAEAATGTKNHPMSARKRRQKDRQKGITDYSGFPWYVAQKPRCVKRPPPTRQATRI